MTRHGSRIVVAALSCLLALTTAAHAGYAWVLWRAQGPHEVGTEARAWRVHAEGAWTLWMMGGDSPWDSVGSFPTREECVASLHQQAQAVEKLGLKVTEDVAAGSFTAMDGDRTVRGQCMLDTSDPRGPRRG